MIIGIDPGLTGAIGLIQTNPPDAAVIDLPVCSRIAGKGNQIDSRQLHTILAGACVHRCSTYIYVELVHGGVFGSKRMKMGAVSAFNFGDTFGAIRTVAELLGCPVMYVRPHAWKKYHGLTGKEKDYARTLASNLYPAVADDLKRKKDIGRAEALLIAAYGLRKETL